MLHPGVNIALAKLTMNELDIARAIRDGDLVSPQKYQNIWLFAIRITDTGLAYRTSKKEYVWRDSSLYLNDDFLERCQGLSVIWEHPPNATLNTEEFRKRIIGSVFIPYIQGTAVWAIVKIHDEEAAEVLCDEQMSTSPSVVLADGKPNLNMEDGTPLLIEGDPVLVDHIAICSLGVWDKQGPPTGVLNETLGERATDMTEEEQKAADAKRRADAEGSIPDRLLSTLNDTLERMDAFNKRMDAEEKRRDDNERRDRAESDAATCGDDDDDDKFKTRMDAEEGEEREELKKAGETEETAADKAKKHRADKEEWRADRRKRADAQRRADVAKLDDDAKRRADAEEEERKKADTRKRADEEDAKKRADSIDMDAIRKAMANMPMRQDSSEYAKLAEVQARADASAYMPLGLKAPEPMQGETEIAYQRRLARGVQKHSKAWGAVDLHTLQPAALEIAVGQIYADAVVASRSCDDVPVGVLLPVQRIDANSGHRVTEFRGQSTIFKNFSPPANAVTKFHTERRA